VKPPGYFGSNGETSALAVSFSRENKIILRRNAKPLVSVYLGVHTTILTLKLRFLIVFS
jgi:hypothetical protein